MGAGFLDQYGIAEQRREGTVKKVVLIAFLIVVLAIGGYFFFRTWSQERVMKAFLTLLERKDYDAAFKMWCTPEVPCKYYDRSKFDEDWGAKSPYANAAGAKIQNTEYCGDVVLFDVSFPGSEPVALHVVRVTELVGFAAWQQCPGKHWQFGQFFKNLFKSGS